MSPKRALVRLIKILHEVSSCGVLGAVGAHLVMLLLARGASPAGYLTLREAIWTVCVRLLVPSVVGVLLTGLLSIAIHGPYRNAMWAWAKALLGMPVLFATLGAVRRGASEAAEVAALVAAGRPHAVDMEEVLRHEWAGLWIVIVLSLVNIALAVWRPRIVETRAVS